MQLSSFSLYKFPNIYIYKGRERERERERERKREKERKKENMVKKSFPIVSKNLDTKISR